VLKKITLVTLLICMLFCAPPGSAQEEIEITSQSAVLMDKDSGRILFERHAHVKRPMASITKIMTAILALEMGNLEDVVTVSPLAAVVEGSSIWLEAGEIKTLEELVYGLMLRSGNDAAYAIAEHIGGSVENFALLMTQRARQLGAYNTRFQNPHGLHDDNHYSTAYDMAVLARHALGIEKFRKIIATEEVIISWPGHEWARILRNQNRLLELYPGGDGIKTGWTTPAGRCFVGSATRDGWQLISVVLNAPSMWEDAMLLLDYGFMHYHRHPVVRQHSYIRQVPLLGGVQENLKVMAADTYSLALSPQEEKFVTYTFSIEEGLQAPIKKGQVVGKLEISLQGERLGDVMLLAGEDVEKAGFFFRVSRFIRRLFSGS
jgi:serine-type D-Ala-D-Ala carboxypeptidase (penicillin-binding protein 5/6)